MGLGQCAQVHGGGGGGGFTGASSIILVQSPGWAPGTRTIQKLEYIKELPSDPAHLQPSPPWANLAGEWQNWTWSIGGDPGQKLGLPEVPTLSLMGEGVAEKAAQLKALVTQSGSESASPGLRMRERRKVQALPRP